jgi:hypothetical protein
MNNRMLALGISAVCAAMLVGIGSLAYRSGAPSAQSAAMQGPSTVGLGSSAVGPRLASATPRAGKEARRRMASKKARQAKNVRVVQVEASQSPSLADRRTNPRLP